MRLKWLVFAVVVGLQFLIAGTVATATWIVVSDGIKTETRRMMAATAETVRLRFQHFLDPAEDAVDLAEFLLEQPMADFKGGDLERLLFEQLAREPVFDAIYFGRVTGEFLMVKRASSPGARAYLVKEVRVADGARSVEFRLRDNEFRLLRSWIADDDTFDPRTRPWFAVARGNGGPQTQWTDPYIFFTSEEPGVTTANAVVDPLGAGWGAVGVDLEIASFSRFLSSLVLPGGGQAFVLDSNGAVAALPNDRGVTPHPLFRPSGEGLQPAVLAAIREQQPALLNGATDAGRSGELRIDGTRFAVTLVDLQTSSLPWTIGVALPTDAVYGWVDSLRNMVVATSVGLAVLGALTLLIAWHCGVERPLSRIGERLKAIALGDDVEDLPVSPLVELRGLDEAVRYAAGMVREREQARNEVVDALLELSDAIEQAPIGIAILEPDGSFVFANRFCQPNAGPERDKLDVFVSFGLDSATLADRLAQTAAGRIFHDETEVQTAGSGETCFRIVFSPFSAAEVDRAPRILVIIEDITASKSLAKGLILARKAAERSDHAKTAFLAQMSHEFRTPLNAVIGFADLLRTRGGAVSVEQFDEYSQHIFESANTLLNMINAVLEFARLERGEGVGELVPVDVPALVEAVVVKGRAMAEARQIALELEVDGPVPAARADVDALTHALLQVVSNSLKFSPPDSVVRLEVAACDQAGVRTVEIGVVDRGRGIDPGDLALVFDPFWRGGSPMRAGHEGLGIGLSIAKVIIQELGGRIDIDSEVASGTRVTISLPVA